MSRSAESDLAAFEAHRPRLLALAYRMLGELGRAEDLVQDAWIRWRDRADEARDPRAYLVTLVSRLCLNELDSARARREESRGDRLPEPVELDDGLARLESLERISMAFVVLLQRLTPAERAVLLLHDVFDHDHAAIAALVGKSEPACRKLLERARAHVAAEKRLLAAPPEEHARLLGAFARAATSGDVSALVDLLADDAEMVTDGGPAGVNAFGARSLDRPLRGAARIAAFVAATASRAAGALAMEERVLNGQPALVLRANGEPFGAVMLGVAEGKVHRVYFQADPARIARLRRT